jgi:hypothetical protein
MKYIIIKSLKGIAHDWLVLIKHPVITLEEFKEIFIIEFWGPQVQMKIIERHKIMTNIITDLKRNIFLKQAQEQTT